MLQKSVYISLTYQQMRDKIFPLFLISFSTTSSTLDSTWTRCRISTKKEVSERRGVDSLFTFNVRFILAPSCWLPCVCVVPSVLGHELVRQRAIYRRKEAREAWFLAATFVRLRLSHASTVVGLWPLRPVQWVILFVELVALPESTAAAVCVCLSAPRRPLAVRPSPPTSSIKVFFFSSSSPHSKSQLSRSIQHPVSAYETQASHSHIMA